MSCVQMTDLLQHEPYRLAYKAAQDALAEKGVRPAAGGDPQANTIAACPELGQVTTILADWLKSDTDAGRRCHSIGRLLVGESVPKRRPAPKCTFQTWRDLTRAAA